MKKASVGLIVSTIAALAIPTLASRGFQEGKLQYSVDASTASPPAAVIQRGNGLVTVIYAVPAIQTGQTFTFTMSVSSTNLRNAYPLNVALDWMGNRDLSTSFTQSTLTMQAAKAPQSTEVTITVDSARNVTRLQGVVKGVPQSADVGEGSGVEVIIVTRPTATGQSEAQTLLQDLTSALAPEAAPAENP